MGRHDSRRKLRVVFVGAAVFVASGIVPACNLVIGIDHFSTDPDFGNAIDPGLPCITESDCPGKDDECTMRGCMGGKCAPILAADGTAVTEQVAGDCKRNQCDGAGNRVDGIADTNDKLDDGKECTIDECSLAGEPTNSPVAAGTSCAMGTMFCDGKGVCGECAIDTNCAMNLVCSMNHCVSKTCINQMKDVDETDVDCGGPNCQPCATGDGCLMDADCQSNFCATDICAEPSCTDARKNGAETDVDCGGSCSPCADNLGCLIGADCASKVCTANVCKVPACDDAVQNGLETDADCGGSCDGCAAGAICKVNADCGSEWCVQGFCAKIVQVTTGTTHACAIVEAAAGNGKLYCWGGNHNGELGIGAVGTAQPLPSQPVNLDKVTSVSTFSNTGTGSIGGHSCARHVLPDGTAKFSCWGRNASGELGNGAQVNSIQPVAIAFAAGIEAIQVVAGGRHTCAITKNGHVQCWGANGQGQVGFNDGVSFVALPQSVGGPGVANPLGAVQIALGTTHTCARLTTGEVSCWGAGARGQTGFGNVANQIHPKRLTNITGVTQLAAGQDFTCGLTNTGLFCWGDDSDGQLGPGAPYITIPTPVPSVMAIQPLPLTLGASGLNGIPDAFGGHSCFIVANGTLVCLGLNDHGQLGIGNTTNTSTATAVNFGPVKQVSLGTQFTCAILEKGAIRCWGRNDLHQLGNGESTDSAVPVPVKWPDP